MARSLLCDLWAQEHLFSFIPRYVWDEQILPRRVPTVCLLQLSPSICFIRLAILLPLLPAFLFFFIWLNLYNLCLFLWCLILLLSPPPSLNCPSSPVTTVCLLSCVACVQKHTHTGKIMSTDMLTHHTGLLLWRRVEIIVVTCLLSWKTSS